MTIGSSSLIMNTNGNGNGNGHPVQMFLPGVICVTRGANGDQVLKVQTVSEWLTVSDCCDRASCRDDVINALIDEGVFTWKWKNYAGPGGTRLVYGPSFEAWQQSKIHIGRIHPQFTLPV